MGFNYKVGFNNCDIILKYFLCEDLFFNQIISVKKQENNGLCSLFVAALWIGFVSDFIKQTLNVKQKQEFVRK